MSIGLRERTLDRLEHEFISNSDPANMINAVGRDGVFEDIALTVVRGVVVGCDNIIAEPYCQVDFCPLNSLQLYHP